MRRGQSHPLRSKGASKGKGPSCPKQINNPSRGKPPVNCLPHMEAAVARWGARSWEKWSPKADELLGGKNRVLCQGQKDHGEAKNRTKGAAGKEAQLC